MSESESEGAREDEDQTPQHPPALPQIRVTRSDTGTWVTPAADARPTAGVSLVRFPLAKLPKSLIDQLATFARQVWVMHRRCIGVLLLLDRHNHQWSFAVPRQHAGPTASCWSGLRADALGAEDNHLLAGSFQTRALEPGEDPVDAPPPHDGIHLVQAMRPRPQGIHTFLRTEGKTLAVPPEDVVFDDLQAALREYLPRLGLEWSQ